jgi:tyrosyl-tRNA synthetase
LSYQVEEVIVRAELEKKLASGKVLRIKLGADPSRPDLHLGHAVVLRKLREFQDLGHQVVFIIGDFTALIGDPSGKSKTRPMISAEEIKKNAETYFQQVGRILDLKKCEIRYNSEWLGKMGAADFISLCAKFTVARILERDDFSKRLQSHTDIHMHELLYPMLQAQDSIDLKADVELGATDQKFNMLAGRDLARRLGEPEQDCIVSRILVGTDGVKKMSKSLDNYIGLHDSADEMYGKTMSIPDAALPNWLDLAADFSPEEINAENAKLMKGENPRDVKARLAGRIVALYHGAEAAKSAAENFVARFKNKEIPDDMPVLKAAGRPLAEVVAEAFAVSKTEARRLIEQNGVKVDGIVAADPLVKVAEGSVIQKGKRGFVRVEAK